MVQKKFILLAIVGLAAITTGNAQQPLSVSDAIEIALANNYQIRVAEAEKEIAQNNNNWGTAGAYPQVDLFVNTQNSFTDQNNPASVLVESSVLSNGVTPGLEASVVLYSGNRIKNTKAQLEELVRQSEISEQIAIENTVQEVVLAYYQVLIQQEQLEVLEEVLDLSRDQIRYQEVKKDFGQAGSFDLLQAKDAYLTDSTNLVNQRNLLGTFYRNLLLVMSVDDLTAEYALTTRLEEVAPSYDLPQLQETLAANNLNLQNLYVARELARINTRIQEAAKYPSVQISTGASYNRNVQNGTLNFDFGTMQRSQDIAGANSNTLNYFLNLSATYNLFNGGVRKRNIENARKEELITQMNINDVKRDLSAQLQNVYFTYQTEVQQISLTEQLVGNARQNLQIAEERFQGGLITSFDYRTIQLNYINANQSLLSAIFSAKTTETDLQQITGRLLAAYLN